MGDIGWAGAPDLDLGEKEWGFGSLRDIYPPQTGQSYCWRDAPPWPTVSRIHTGYPH